MQKAFSFSITQAAASELIRQSVFAGTPGIMHIELVGDGHKEGWLHVRLRAGSNEGVPLSRTDGITLFAQSDQLNLFQGLNLNYYCDLSGGGFLISTPAGAEGCACGAGFKLGTALLEDD